ncbi:host attachment protein [Psychromonas sp. MB-3u-54]|uniref:host attachment protein n=1 Tax=Psychromonas sp. MB-3u-54 TaxID=2058319 RepID=UPI000C31D4A5|nr:host attachment protein [Psychromonas sp. MB-3u-54]PKH01987.1 host attachment protein [Psychromonas sp. MB-3u-54]
MSKTLVMVTNASAARVFSYLAHEEFSLLKEFSHPESRQKGVDLVSDRPGQGNAKGGHGALVPPNNPKQIEAERFAHELASWLDDQRKQNSCNQIMLVADPSFLGLLNKSLNNQTAQLVFKSLNKDYSKVVPRDLPEMLGLIAPKKDPLR